MLRKFTLNGKHACNTLSEGSKKTDDTECLGECERECVCVCVCVCRGRGGGGKREKTNMGKCWELNLGEEFLVLF